MAQEYKITKVSEQEPRQYEGQYGTVYYHKVMLEGHKKPVSIGKKTADKPNVGDVLYGTIKDNPEYDEDGFKAEKKPFSSNTKTFGKSPEEQSAIMRMNALTNAVNFHKDPMASGGADLSTIIATAQTLYDWVSGSKTVNTNNEEITKEDF